MIASPAKINLTLEILGRRPDGYHELATIFQVIDLSDNLTIDWEANKTELKCADPTVPQNDSNLILKALGAVEKHMGHPVHAKMILEKKIPMGAGLGGGSSNA